MFSDRTEESSAVQYFQVCFCLLIGRLWVCECMIVCLKVSSSANAVRDKDEYEKAFVANCT